MLLLKTDYSRAEVVFGFNRNNLCEGFQPSQGFRFRKPIRPICRL